MPVLVQTLASLTLLLFLGVRCASPVVAGHAVAQRHHRKGERLWEAARRNANASALTAAAEAYAASWAADPSFTTAFWDLAFTCRVGALLGSAACPPRDEVQRVLHEELDRNGRSGISQLVALSSLDGASFRRVAEAWASVFSPDPPSAAALPLLVALPPPGGVLRVAYVSALFQHHPVGHHIGGVIRLRDTAAFTIACFSTAPSDNSAHRARLEQSCLSGEGCEFFQLPSAAGPVGVAAAVRSWGAHIVVYLDGYDSAHVMGAVLLRMAPLQVSFFGFLGTLGAPAIDAVGVDDVVVPLGNARLRSSFSEHLLLRHPLTFFLQDYAEVHPELLQPDDTAAPPMPVSLCNFGQLYKVDVPTLRSWLVILLRTAELPACSVCPKAPLPLGGPLLHLLGYPPVSPPGILAGVRALAPSLVSVWHQIVAERGASFVMGRAEEVVAVAVSASGETGDTGEQLEHALADTLISRLRFEPLRDEHEHLLWKRRTCGLALDTPHYNGHVSVADLLAAGVPVVTLTPLGEAFAGRAASSIVAAAGAPAFFTSPETHAQYEDAAVAYVRAVQGLPPDAGAPEVPRVGGAPWRPSRNLSVPLFDTRAWVRSWEALLADAAHDRVESSPVHTN